jgi:hypothetical protein
LIPCIPFAGLGAFLALGKYNGRDAEVYIFKFVISNLKPKLMVYKREPFVEDLDKKASEWTATAIEKRWGQEIMQEKKEEESGKFLDIEAEEKARRIRDLGSSIDTGVLNTLAEVKRRQLEIDSKEALINQARLAGKGTRSNNVSINTATTSNSNQPKPTYKPDNFFDPENNGL